MLVRAGSGLWSHYGPLRMTLKGISEGKSHPVCKALSGTLGPEEEMD